MPPPFRHKFLSASSAQEKELVMGATSGWDLVNASREELVGGMQVALVKRSTNLRMKNFGNVPPRLETLGVR